MAGDHQACFKWWVDPVVLVWVVLALSFGHAVGAFQTPPVWGWLLALEGESGIPLIGSEALRCDRVERLARCVVWEFSILSLDIFLTTCRGVSACLVWVDSWTNDR